MTPRILLLITLALCCAAGGARAQTEFAIADDVDEIPRPEVPTVGAIRAQVGFGVSATTEIRRKGEEDPYGTGLFVEVDRVWRANKAIQPTLYGGVVLTGTREESCSHPDDSCRVSTTTAFVGGKFRLTVPIPYVGPFLEFGAGVSGGRISSLTGRSDDNESRGLLFHIPVGLGLSLGRDRTTTVAFSYLFYPNRNHVDGAVAVGVDVALD